MHKNVPPVDRRRTAIVVAKERTLGRLADGLDLSNGRFTVRGTVDKVVDVLVDPLDDALQPRKPG